MAIHAPDVEPRTSLPLKDCRWRRHGQPVLYGGAFAAYVGLGLFDERVLSSWIIGVAFLVAVAWGVPALWRRLR